MIATMVAMRRAIAGRKQGRSYCDLGIFVTVRKNISHINRSDCHLNVTEKGQQESNLLQHYTLDAFGSAENLPGACSLSPTLVEGPGTALRVGLNRILKLDLPMPPCPALPGGDRVDGFGVWFGSGGLWVSG